MVALNEQFRHSSTTARGRRSQVTGYGLQRSGESGVDFIDQRSLITDQKRRTSNDLFFDHYSLVIERSAGANETILCDYPDNKRVSTDIGTGLNDPDTGLWYIRSRTYNSIPGTVLRQEPKSRQATGVAARVLQRDPIGYAGGINLYEYVGGLADAAVDPMGLAGETGNNGTAPPNPWIPPPGGWRLWPIPPEPARGPAAPPNFPPAPADSPVCDRYPCSYTYMGANARCFCECDGNSPWSQYGRGCLAELCGFGASAEMAHTLCYLWATGKYGLQNVPYGTLVKCYGQCSNGAGGPPPWPWPPIAN